MRAKPVVINRTIIKARAAFFKIFAGITVKKAATGAATPAESFMAFF